MPLAKPKRSSRNSSPIKRRSSNEKKSFPVIDYLGTTQWFMDGNVDGKLHRGGGKPALEFPDGSKQWFVNGKLHRVLKPAIVTEDLKEWYIKGKLHRVGGPAVVLGNGDKEWWLNGQRDRKGGKPAITQANGYKAWYIKGRFIRDEQGN